MTEALLNPNWYYGKICSKHPEQNGLRNKYGRCVTCARERGERTNVRRRTPEYRERRNALRRAVKVTRKYGKICPDHPHLNGLRWAKNGDCIDCARERRLVLSQTPAARERQRARRQRPEVRARKFALQQTPEARARERARRQTERVRANNRASRRALRDKIRANGSTVYAEKSARNPQYKFAHGYRRRFLQELKKALLSKTEKTLDFLGCTLTFAINHIAAQFQPGITWENYGKDWHIDHRIPVSAFNLHDPVDRLRAFHWTNLQPMLKTDNMRKHHHLPPLDPDPDGHLFWPDKRRVLNAAALAYCIKHYKPERT